MPDRFLVIVAMQSELVHLVPADSPMLVEQTGPWEETHTAIGDTSIIAIRCGIGMVAASAATEHGIQRYQPTAIFNFGCAGSHRRDLYPGDVVIGEASVAHTPVRIDTEGNEVFSHGGFGVGDDLESEHYFASDPDLLRTAQGLGEHYQPETWPIGQHPRSPIVRSGNVGSGDVWNQSNERLTMLSERHGTLCEDMEAAAIAQIAKLHNLPFLTIKDISNNEFMTATEFDDHGAGIITSELGKRAGNLLWQILTALTSRQQPQDADPSRELYS